MKRNSVTLGLALAALVGTAALAETGIETFLPAGAVQALRSMRGSEDAAANKRANHLAQKPTPRPQAPTPRPQAPAPRPHPQVPTPRPQPQVPTPRPQPHVPTHQPPVNHPPVVVTPGRPGQPVHGMPKPPTAPAHRIDPSHNGDNHAVQPPDRDDNGHRMDHRPNRDAHGRDIPPGRDQMSRIDQRDFRQNIHQHQDHWDSRDHEYHWHDWNGWRVCHHYDTFGFHWWGFYVGTTYFWTRYHDDNYWWYEPYWHRWVYMHDGQWWWTHPDGRCYVYTNGGYYLYGNGTGGVVLTPDPTPPVDVPPGPPAAADQTSVYSLDGARSIQITGAGKDAYLYDLTVADPNDPAAQGRYLASGVKTAVFVNDGDEVREIILTVVDDSGNQSTMTFNRDGAATGASSTRPGVGLLETLHRNMGRSASFRALKTGFSW